MLAARNNITAINLIVVFMVVISLNANFALATADDLATGEQDKHKGFHEKAKTDKRRYKSKLMTNLGLQMGFETERIECVRDLGI